MKLTISTFLFAFVFLFAASEPTLAQDKDWRPISPQEMQMKTASVESDADAEVIFWEVRVDDSNPENMVMKHYLRVKIFSEKGREKYSKVDIPFTKGIKIKDIKARVTKADGTAVELAKADVFDREIAKTDKIKVKAKSFAVPNIEIGALIEYRYQEVYDQGSANDMRMMFQHDVPIQTISYYFKPYNDARYLTFNMADNKFIKDKNGFYRATMENVPAVKDEPQMPPMDEVRSWLILYYTRYTKSSSMDFWARVGGWLAETWDIKDTLKPNKDLKAAAAQIVGDAKDPNEQMQKIFEFCKTKIRNITYDTTLTEDQKDEIKPSKSANDTYKKQQGNVTDINELFASLASALGHETRLAFGGDRSKKFFDPSQAHESFIHFIGAAVKIDGRWKYYSPGDIFVPYGMLSWHEEATSVLLLNNKDFMTTETTSSGYDKSLAKRTGRFKLSEDGTLEGTVKIEYSGHISTERKLDNYKESDTKREEMLKETVKSAMSTSELSSISIQNFADPEKPFVYEYKIRVPNYAQRTGKRIFLQPGFFEYGVPAMFSSASRKYAIFFRRPWSESDDISIELPANYILDNADAPARVADASNVGSVDIKMTFDVQKSMLSYKRNFHFGGGGIVLFQQNAYQPLKGLFDAFHKADSHTITLRQK